MDSIQEAQMKEICEYSNNQELPTPHLATQHIVWGCLNLHVCAISICRYHISAWETKFAGKEGIWCLLCAERAADYLVDRRGMGL